MPYLGDETRVVALVQRLLAYQCVELRLDARQHLVWRLLGNRFLSEALSANHARGEGYWKECWREPAKVHVTSSAAGMSRESEPRPSGGRSCAPREPIACDERHEGPPSFRFWGRPLQKRGVARGLSFDLPDCGISRASNPMLIDPGRAGSLAVAAEGELLPVAPKFTL